MALADGATNITSSAPISGGVGKVLGDAVIAFNKVNVISPLVISRVGVTGAKTVEFADWTVASYADVSAATEAACMILRIDDVIATAKSAGPPPGAEGGMPDMGGMGGMPGMGGMGMPPGMGM